MTELRQHIDNYFKTKSTESKDTIINTLKQLEPNTLIKNEALFHALVPDTGKADTIMGEILRNLHRVGARHIHNEEQYFQGIGVETCGSSAVYLIHHTNQIIRKLIQETIPINYIADKNTYTDSVQQLFNIVGVFMRANPTLAIQRNTVDGLDKYTVEAAETFFDYDQMLNGEETQ